jgi:DNA-binding IclR family transcriptional regulator
MGDLSLNPTDQAILELLDGGRCTPSYIAQATDYSRGNIQNRLLRLVEHGYVKQLGGGLYELIEDPRNKQSKSDEE